MPFTTRFEEHTIRLLACGWVNMLALPNRWNFSRVSAPYWRLYWNDRPGAELCEGARRYRLTPRVLALVPPHLVLSTRNRLPVNHLHVHFLLLQPTLSEQARTTLISLKPAGKRLLDAVLACLRRRPNDRKLSFLARALIEWTLSCLAEHAAPAPPADARLAGVLAYIEQHLGARLCNRDLAYQAGMSRNALIRLFHAQFGMTPHAILLRKRVEQACLRLQFTGASLDHIAEHTGFCDRYHFSRTFKRLQGVTPAAFRRQACHPPVPEPGTGR